MKAKPFLIISLLVVLAASVGACHELASDTYDDQDYRTGYGSYRDGFRDGRAYERRQDDRRDRYYDNYRRRW